MLNLLEHENLVSSLADKEGRIGETYDPFGELIKESYDSIVPYLHKLPAIYRHLVQLYYLNGLTQDRIARHLEISQAAVSTRLATLKDRLKFILQMPTQDPMQAKRDLNRILPAPQAEFAICFYWEVLQNRVKSFIETSTSGASNKLRALIKEMEATQDALDPESVKDQEMLILTESYLEYFRTIQISGDRHKFAYRKNDNNRRTSYIESPEAAKELFYERPVIMTGTTDRIPEPPRLSRAVVTEQKGSTPFEVIFLKSGATPRVPSEIRVEPTRSPSVFTLIQIPSSKPAPQYA